MKNDVAIDSWSDRGLDGSCDLQTQCFERISRRSSGPHRRRTRPGASIDGIHRRRGSRWTWGHGRQAQLLDLAAVARILVLSLVTVVAGVSDAATIGVLQQVGNPGNAGNVTGSGTFGAVGYEYAIGQTEVTNAQYVEFLNAVATTSDSQGLYNELMAGDRGGILRSGTVGAYSYSAKDPEAGARPVNFVSVTSSARYVNWLTNGAPVNPGDVNAVINQGSYTLTSGPQAQALLRNPQAKYVLPTVNEWYKAAFYDPSLNGGSGGYWRYATQSNTAPSSSANPLDTGTNLGSFNQPNNGTSVPMAANGLANSLSFYGVLGMVGNVSEWAETSSPTNGLWIGGWFTMTDAQVETFASFDFGGNFGGTQNGSTGQGFRIAEVAPVPEPATYITAAIGLAMAGARLRRRRKATAA